MEVPRAFLFASVRAHGIPRRQPTNELPATRLARTGGNHGLMRDLVACWFYVCLLTLSWGCAMGPGRDLAAPSRSPVPAARAPGTVVRGQDEANARGWVAQAPGRSALVGQSDPQNLWNEGTAAPNAYPSAPNYPRYGTNPLPGPSGPAPSQVLPPPVGLSNNPGTGQLPENPFLSPAAGPLAPPVGPMADVMVNVEEAPTGRLMMGVGINSDAGLTGQIVIDERNFDWRRFPTSVDDLMNGKAWRGGGQGFRIEAVPGNRLQRYLVNFVEPYLFETPISFSLSGFYYDRNFFDWSERRVGGRVGLGYRLTPDLSINGSLRAENVDVHSPRIRGITELEEVLGDTDVYGARVTLSHDTRDVPFFPTEGHLLELSYEQVFGEFDYPRGTIDYYKYFLLAERPDQSGRHVLSNSFRVGFSGSQTPLFENFFAGGQSTLRGFNFRGASPENLGITVGGEFMLLGSTEYFFPITADDMLRGVVFADYGTVEEKIEINSEDFRVAVGFGLRITVPAMGPAPISLDFAVPLAREGTDDIQNFSFYFGALR